MTSLACCKCQIIMSYRKSFWAHCTKGLCNHNREKKISFVQNILQIRFASCIPAQNNNLESSQHLSCVITTRIVALEGTLLSSVVMTNVTLRLRNLMRVLLFNKYSSNLHSYKKKFYQCLHAHGMSCYNENQENLKFIQNVTNNPSALSCSTD